MDQEWAGWLRLDAWAGDRAMPTARPGSIRCRACGGWWARSCWRAGRGVPDLDRRPGRAVADRARQSAARALDAHLLRRAAAAAGAGARSGTASELYAAARIALDAEPDEREAAENDLTRQLRAVAGSDPADPACGGGDRGQPAAGAGPAGAHRPGAGRLLGARSAGGAAVPDGPAARAARATSTSTTRPDACRTSAAPERSTHDAADRVRRGLTADPAADLRQVHRGADWLALGSGGSIGRGRSILARTLGQPSTARRAAAPSEHRVGVHRPAPPTPAVGTARVKRGMAEMLKGGVIMDVVTAEQAKIAEDAGAVAVMALERVPADIRAQGGVSRMSDPDMIDGIIDGRLHPGDGQGPDRPLRRGAGPPVARRGLRRRVRGADPGRLRQPHRQVGVHRAVRLRRDQPGRGAAPDHRGRRHDPLEGRGRHRRRLQRHHPHAADPAGDPPAAGRCRADELYRRGQGAAGPVRAGQGGRRAAASCRSCCSPPAASPPRPTRR